jgi:serine protease
MKLFKRLLPSPRGWALCALLALGQAMAALPELERNPVHGLRLDEAADTARVIVKFKPDSALLRKHALKATASASETQDAVLARASSLGARLGRSLVAGRALNAHAQVVSASGIQSAALAALLAAQDDVEYAVVDQRRSHFAVPNDPLYAQGPPLNGNTGGPGVGQWYLRAPGTELVSSINAPGAWDLSTGSASIVVAVLDTGVRPEHPDLAGRLLAGYNMISDTLTSNDGAGRDADASDPGDWITAQETSARGGAFYQCGAEDSSWHGTMTSSLVGASANDGVGMAGVAWGVQLLPVRVLGKCGGFDSDIIAGMQWAAGLAVPGVPANPTPARVINMSLGGADPCSQSYIDAIGAIQSTLQPVVIVASAGNSSGHALGAPANCPGVISVAGLRHAGTKVGFSDLGPQIALSAPAGNCVNTAAAAPCLYPILAATNTGTKGPVASSYTDAFNASVGTSFSAPLVAGTVALMLSVQPDLTPDQVKALLQKSARAFPTGDQTSALKNCAAPDGNDQLECYCTTSTCGAGMLDAAAAVAAAKAFGNATTSLSFVTGWNLEGNGTDAAIDVAATFSDAAKVESVWKWLPSSRWAFYAPTLTTQALADYAAGKGYDVLATVGGGEGFWLKALQPFSASVLAGKSVGAAAVASGLHSGWNLVASGDSLTPRQFNDSLGSAAAATASVTSHVVSVWAWDSERSSWYFYAPSLEAQGGTALADYAGSSGYLDFIATGKSLAPGVGFWVNKP